MHYYFAPRRKYFAIGSIEHSIIILQRVSTMQTSKKKKFICARICDSEPKSSHSVVYIYRTARIEILPVDSAG